MREFWRSREEQKLICYSVNGLPVLLKTLSVLIILTVVFQIFTYLSIYWRLKKSWKKFRKPSAVKKSESEKQERRLLKLAVSIVAAFALCWLPFSFLMLWGSKIQKNNKILGLDTGIVYLIAVITSILNSFLILRIYQEYTHLLNNVKTEIVIKTLCMISSFVWRYCFLRKQHSALTFI